MDKKKSNYLKVGLTGSLGSGKSEVRKIFESFGALTIDADAVGRRLTVPGEPAYNKILETWGETVLNPDGTLDRRALADIVFSSPAETEKVNSILHPLIIERENELAADYAAKSDYSIIITEASLMIEVGSWKRFDRIVLVCCPIELRKQRIKKSRGLSSELFDQISFRQMPEEEKRRYADYIIENDGTLMELRMKTGQIYFKLIDDLKNKKVG